MIKIPSGDEYGPTGQMVLETYERNGYVMEKGDKSKV